MLSIVSTGFGRRVALLLAVLYSACVLAPSVALAYPNSMAAHCLMEMIAGVPNDHDAGAFPHANAHHHHSDGNTSHDGNKASHDGKDNAANCCGLFSIVAIGASGSPVLVTTGPAAIAFLPLAELLQGQGPERIIRPPIS